MSCLSRFGIVSEGSDITFSLRPEKSGLFPDISDMQATLKAVHSGSDLFECSIGTPSVNGSTVTLEVDIISQYLSFYISPLETAGLSNDTDLEIYTTLVSVEYGTRTEGKGFYRICEVE